MKKVLYVFLSLVILFVLPMNIQAKTNKIKTCEFSNIKTIKKTSALTLGKNTITGNSYNGNTGFCIFSPKKSGTYRLTFNNVRIKGKSNLDEANCVIRYYTVNTKKYTDSNAWNSVNLGYKTEAGGYVDTYSRIAGTGQHQFNDAEKEVVIDIKITKTQSIILEVFNGDHLWNDYVTAKDLKIKKIK